LRLRLPGVAAALAVAVFSTPAHAIRPFVTDDAHTVGRGHLQLETYWRLDRATMQHWILPAFGPTEWLELTLGGVHGVTGLQTTPPARTYAIGGPIVQGKFLLHNTIPNHLPGVGVVVGGVSPAGTGGLQAPGWSGFSYLAVTQAFFKEDDFMIHVNVGVSTVAAPGIDPARLTWGVGTQIETLYEFHLIGEIFSGDPYAIGTGGAYQAGFRLIFNDHLQLDATCGGGLWGDNLLPFFVSSGVRIVTHDLF